MSDPEDDNARPDDSVIETTLRDIVQEAAKHDEDVTVKGARTRAEEQLGLNAGFFKDDPKWKQRSSDVIHAAFEEPPTPEQPVKAPPKPKAGTKRKSDEKVEQTKKRRKQSPVVESDNEDTENLEPEVAVKDKIKARKEDAKSKLLQIEPKSAVTSELSSPPDTADEEAPPPLKPNGGPAVQTKEEDDESDLSSLIDDAPPKKKRQKKSTSPTATKSKPPKTVKAAKVKPAKPEKTLSPDEEEIKRLQSYLLKCGIRKLWHRELEPYSTSKEKIKHLKGMLEEAGMTGRFSAEKAKQIKEQRELKAELEAAKEFNDQWGHEQEDEDDEDDGGRPKRHEADDDVPQRKGRLKPRGLIDFGDDDDSD